MIRQARNRRCERRAMTLIELMVSTLLAALMMTALTSIVWSASRESRQLRVEGVGQFPTTQLVQQMRIDFANARGMLVDPRGLTLFGFLGTDPVNRRPMLTPGRVRYEITTASGRAVLTRSSESSREPVWLGCTSLRVESLETIDAEDELLPPAEAGGLPPLPSRFRVTMVGENGRILWREVIQHHEG